VKLWKALKYWEKTVNVKMGNNMTIFRIRRWSEMFHGRMNLGSRMRLNHEFLQQLFQILNEETIRIQKDTIKITERGDLIRIGVLLAENYIHFFRLNIKIKLPEITSIAPISIQKAFIWFPIGNFTFIP
jgi:hypothetical protein